VSQSLSRLVQTYNNHSSRKRTKHGKKRKTDFLDFEKCRGDNVYVYSPEDHGDHPQLVLVSFTQQQGHYILTKNESF